MKIMSFAFVFGTTVAAHAGLNTTQNIGTEVKTYLSPNNVQEICVIPKHITLADGVDNYAKKDSEKEQKLCAESFYTEGAVLCPKYKSTSAATNVYSVDSTTGKNDFQNVAQCANLSKENPTEVAGKILPDKVGKFKQNEPLNDTTGTNISSPLAYYHISRALGGMLNIPVAVIRTMDVQEHLKVNDLFFKIKAAGIKVSPGTLKGWTSFNQMHNAARTDSNVYTADQQQIFGVFIKGGGTDKAYELDTMDTLKTQDFFKITASTQLIQDSLANQPDLTKRGQVLLAKDLSDMVIIDTILEQTDRYSGSNIEKYAVYFDGQKYLSAKDYEKAKKTNPQLNLQPLKRLSIQDNDAGLRNSKNTSNLARVEGLKHISPVTYQKLQLLSQYSDLQQFLISETLMSEKASTRVVNTIKVLATKFKSDCQKGTLKVDLDVDLVLANNATDSQSKAYCLENNNTETY